MDTTRRRVHDGLAMHEPDPRLDYPATRRNAEPILAVLRDELRGDERVLEIGSGSGQHAACFAAAMPGLRWQPSDVDEQLFASIRAWTSELGNVAEPIVLDASQPFERWFAARDESSELGPCGAHEYDAIFSANVLHIAPWSVCVGLLEGAAIGLRTSVSCVILYGPFMRAGRHTAPSNEAFDRSLRARDPRWGVRDLDEIVREAQARDLELARVVEMPANNLCVVLRR